MQDAHFAEAQSIVYRLRARQMLVHAKLSSFVEPNQKKTCMKPTELTRMGARYTKEKPGSTEKGCEEFHRDNCASEIIL